MARLADEIHAQHADEAAFLWGLRAAAAGDVAYDLKSLAGLDERLEAHLDGLRVGGADAMETARAELEGGEVGEVFVAATIAIDRSDARSFARVLDVAGGDPKLSRGIVSGLAWSAPERVGKVAAALLDPRCPEPLRGFGVDACVAHGRDPGAALGRAFLGRDVRLRACAAHAVGALGKADLLPEVDKELAAGDPGSRLAAASTAAMFGRRGGAEALLALATQPGAEAADAADLAMRGIDVAAAVTWIPTFEREAGPRVALAAAGALGDPSMIPWILDCAAEPAMARCAAFAFSLITGIDLAAARLTAKAPPGFVAGPTDHPDDEDVELDPDAELPWPDLEALRPRWETIAARFPHGVRHLAGMPMDEPGWLMTVLRQSNQRVRRAAATEMAFRQPTDGVFEVRAPVVRQTRLLARR